MKHSHYTKNVSHLSAIDVYRVLSLFGVTDQAIGHAIKKLLCPGQRGVKTKRQDIQEAIDTLERWKAMEDEDSANLYSAEQHSIKTDHAALVDVAPDPACKVIEPAAAIDDESPRMQAIAQNGNDGLHYHAMPIEVVARNITDAQMISLSNSMLDREIIGFVVTHVDCGADKGNSARLQQVIVAKVTP